MGLITLAPRIGRDPVRPPRLVVRPFPPPIGGLNDFDSLVSMKKTEALKLTNFFPGTTRVEKRKGYSSHSDTASANAIYTLAELVTAAGANKLLAITSAAEAFDVTTDTPSVVTWATAGTIGRWQTVPMAGRLLMFNGTDTPQNWDGGAALADSTYTSTGWLTATAIIQGISHRNRLYVVVKDSTSFGYGDTVDAYQGQLNEVPLASVLRLGGSLMFVATWSFDDGGGLEDLLVVMSTEGEVLIYSGSYPGDSAWQKVAQWNLPKPLGRQAFIAWGKDLLLLTEGGIISLAYLMQEGTATEDLLYVSRKIQNSFRQVARDYRANDGWQGVVYPDGPWLLVNVPKAANDKSDQYVMNLITRAWCKFTGWNALCWSLLDGNIYFGASDGVVYRANNTQSDNTGDINVELMTAFWDCNLPGRQKLFNMARPLVASSGNLEFVMDVDVDYQEGVIADTVSVTASDLAMWDTATWDVDEWDLGLAYYSEWQAVSGMGDAASIRLKAAWKNLQFALSGFDLAFIIGGPM
jgi:hypothetical protein